MSIFGFKKDEIRPVDKLVNLYPSISAASTELGISRQLIEMWVKRGFIPFKRGEYIEQKTGGKITRYEIWEAAGKKS